MTTLYIDRKGASVSHDRARLWIRYAEEQQSVLVRSLDRVVITAGCQLDSRTLLMLNEAAVPVVILHPRKYTVTWCGGWHHGNTARRLAQYQLAQDGELCTALARQLVRLKLMQQRRALRHLMPLYPARRRALFAGCAQLAKLTDSFGTQCLDEIRGLEGAGARSYFAAYCQVYPERFNFTGRNRRPPRDPVNACLSFAYSLLTADALRTLYTCGLDPSIGFYHQPAYGRPSLACDLVEIVRTRADRCILDMFRRQVLDSKHFKQRDGGVFLDKEGRSRFFACWEAQAGLQRHALNRTASAWATRVSQLAEHP